MKVELLHHTPLWVASKAIRKCWASEDKSDTLIDGAGKIRDITIGQLRKVECGTKDKELIHRVGNKNKHSSTLEHLTYNFEISGVSRALLQEQMRTRIASPSVESSRYTLAKILKNYGEIKEYLVMTGNEHIDNLNIKHMENLKTLLKEHKISNDISKYALVEAFKTSFAWTINARSLQNFLALRTPPHALWEIQNLANEIFKQLPGEHKYLFEDSIYNKETNGTN